MLLESDGFQILLEVVEEVARSLLESVQALLQLVDLAGLLVSSCHFDINTSSSLFFWSHLIPVRRAINWGVNERGCVVHLLGCQL